MKDLFAQVIRQLSDFDVATPELDTRIIFAAALEVKQEDIVRNFFDNISLPDKQKIEMAVARRINREPVAKIIGKKEFWGADFITTRDTLDPRPETETIVEAVLELLPERGRELRVIDFGTGTGCLLISLLKEFHNSSGIGVDISDAALIVAKQNCLNSGLNKKIEFIKNNWGEGIAGKFDLIVSNPPYIKNSEIKNLQPEINQFEPHVALAGGKDGVDCYEQLAPHVKNLLHEDGYAILEIGEGQENSVEEIFNKNNLKLIKAYGDLAKITRCLAFKHN